jgi:hypothetical protein
MSGISSISTYGSNSYDWLQKISNLSTGQSSGTSVAKESSSEDSLFSALSESGLDSEELESLNEEIKSSISSALQEAEDSGDTTDFRQIIKDAIDKALEDNGIDMDELTGSTDGSTSGIGGMPPPPPPSTDSSSSTDSSYTNGTDPLSQALESMGITGDDLTSLLDQINTAVGTAVQSAEDSGDTTDFQTIIKNAVDQTLEDNGIDPKDVQAQMQSSTGEVSNMPPPPPGGMPPTGSSEDTTTEDSTSTTSTSSSGSTTSTDQIDELIKLLQDLLSQLQSGTSTNDSLTGYLFDEQS